MWASNVYLCLESSKMSESLISDWQRCFFAFFSRRMPKSYSSPKLPFKASRRACQSVVTFVSVQMRDRKPLNKQEPYLAHNSHVQALFVEFPDPQSFTCKEAMMKVEEETCSSRTENVNYISNNLCQYGTTSKGQIVGPQEDSMILSKTSLPKIDELIKTFIRHNCNTCGQLVGFSDAKVRNQSFLSPFHLCSPKSRLLFFII